MLPNRKNIRWEGHDYRWSAPYFLTICTYQKRCVFGRIENGEMHLNKWGKIAHDRWLTIPEHHSHIELDAFIIMPNHLHGILLLIQEPPKPEPDRDFAESLAGSISTVVGSYKSGVSRRIGEIRGRRTKVWQPKFYDHVVRIKDDLDSIRQYILNNPAKWAEDLHHSNAPLSPPSHFSQPQTSPY